MAQTYSESYAHWQTDRQTDMGASRQAGKQAGRHTAAYIDTVFLGLFPLVWRDLKTDVFVFFGKLTTLSQYSPLFCC